MKKVVMRMDCLTLTTHRTGEIGGGMKKQRLCLKCDYGKGYKMIEIYSYKVSGDVDKFLCWVCPNCHRNINPPKSTAVSQGA